MTTTVSEQSARGEIVALKILVGVDQYETYRSAVALLGRLRFPKVGLVLAHIGEPILDPAFFVPEVLFGDVTDIIASQERRAQEMLDRAESTAKQAGIGPDAELVYWPTNMGGPIDPGERLNALADEREVEMVVVGSENKGPMHRFLCGSVEADLAAHAHRSFLIGRGEISRTGPVRVVFATDLSPYADRCFQHLLDLAPEGLAEIFIVAANDGRADLADSMATKDWGAAGDLGLAMRPQGEALVRRASAKGYMACFELRDGDAKDVLAAAMEGTRADVLVLGARGHGLLHRTFLGSNACREVAQSSYPVWVIRFADDSKA